MYLFKYAIKDNMMCRGKHGQWEYDSHGFIIWSYIIKLLHLQKS